MRVKKICCYCGPNYNLLPAVLLTFKDDGFIIAFKFWTGHLGFYLQTSEVTHERA